MEDNKEPKEYKVQRKVIAWEETYIEAESFQEAVDKAYDLSSYEWEMLNESEATDDYWIEDTESGESRTVLDGEWSKN